MKEEERGIGGEEESRERGQHTLGSRAWLRGSMRLKRASEAV